MNHRADHETISNTQAECALECSVEVQPISGADLRRGRYVRYDGRGDVIPLYRWASSRFHCQNDSTASHAAAGPCSVQRTLSLCPAAYPADLQSKLYLRKLATIRPYYVCRNCQWLLYFDWVRHLAFRSQSMATRALQSRRPDQADMNMSACSSSDFGCILIPSPTQWPGFPVLASFLVGMPSLLISFFNFG